MRRGIGILASLALLPVLASCDGDGTGAAVLVDNDPAHLVSRLVMKNVPVPVDGTRTLTVHSGAVRTDRSSTPAELIELLAEIHAPRIDDQVLQATGVVIRGQYAFVSYNVQGEVQKGAVQVVHFLGDTPELVAEALFPGHDVNALDVCGDWMFLALASADLGQATVGLITLNPLRQFNTDFREIPLESHAANAIRCLTSGTVAVTHGDGGGLSLLDKDLVRSAYVPLHDARSVDDWTAGKFVVLSGTDATLHVVDGGVATASFPLVGATIPQSKSTVQVEGDNALVAVNDGGVQLVDLSTGAVAFTIAPPVVPELDPPQTVSNSAVAQNRTLFLAQGEAGLYLAHLDKGVNQSPKTVEILGHLVMGDLQSSNDVTYSGNKAFVAAGTGGFKILSISTPN
jgi:hypothetical protein